MLLKIWLHTNKNSRAIFLSHINLYEPANKTRITFYYLWEKSQNLQRFHRNNNDIFGIFFKQETYKAYGTAMHLNDVEKSHPTEIKNNLSLHCLILYGQIHS